MSIIISADSPGSAISCAPSDLESQLTNKATLKERAVIATMWSLGGQSLEIILRIASNLILARLLFPEAFGLMALVTVITEALNRLSETGIRDSAIYHPRGDELDFVNTAWTVRVVRGAILWLLACLIAWPMSQFYETPLLLKLLPVVGLGAFLQGLSSKRVLTATRHMDVKRLSVINLLAYGASVVVMVTFAWVYQSVWALAFGALFSRGMRTVLTYAMLEDSRSSFRWQRDVVTSLIDYGKWIFVAGLVGFLATNFDRLMLGKLLPMEVLGVYSIAAAVTALPLLLTARLGAFVLQPLFAAFARESAIKVVVRVEQVRRVILPAGLASCLGLALFSPTFFRYLYDSRYWDAGWMAQLMTINVWLSILQIISGRLLLALGKSRPAALSKSIVLVIGGSCGLFGCLQWGVTGLIAGMLIGNIGGYLVLAFYLAQHSLFVLRTDAGYSIVFVALALLGRYGPQLVVTELGMPQQGGLLFLIALAGFVPVAVFAARRAAVATFKQNLR